MLATRFRNIANHLCWALQAMVERGRMASAVVLAIGAAVAVRQGRLEALMLRFEAGLLRVRAAGVRRTPGASAKPAPVRPARAWPEHRPGWLHLVGSNNPSIEVRVRWSRGEMFRSPPAVQQMVAFAAKLRALLEEDAAMRGLLGASREARRIVRWFLHASDTAKLPAILTEPRRAEPRRAEPKQVRAPRARRPDPWTRRAPVARPPGPFEAAPDNLSREEREARGLPVPPPVMLYDPSAFPITPDRWQRKWTWMDG